MLDAAAGPPHYAARAEPIAALTATCVHTLLLNRTSSCPTSASARTIEATRRAYWVAALCRSGYSRKAVSIRTVDLPLDSVIAEERSTLTFMRTDEPAFTWSVTS